MQQKPRPSTTGLATTRGSGRPTLLGTTSPLVTVGAAELAPDRMLPLLVSVLPLAPFPPAPALDAPTATDFVRNEKALISPLTRDPYSRT